VTDCIERTSVGAAGQVPRPSRKCWLRGDSSTGSQNSNPAQQSETGATPAHAGWFKDKRARERLSWSLLLFVVGGLLLGGCASRRGTAEERETAAEELFNFTTRTFHIPSAEAEGAEQERLRLEAAKGYRTLLRKYPDQAVWAAQALRSLGNIEAARGDLDGAVKRFRAVGREYPGEGWEVLMSWKTAADLLWEAGRLEEAREFYQELVARFDDPEAPAVVRTVVRGSKGRLAGDGGADR